MAGQVCECGGRTGDVAWLGRCVNVGGHGMAGQVCVCGGRAMFMDRMTGDVAWLGRCMNVGGGLGTPHGWAGV